MLEDGPVGFEGIGFFGGDEVGEIRVEIGPLHFSVLYVFESVGDDVQGIVFIAQIGEDLVCAREKQIAGRQQFQKTNA